MTPPRGTGASTKPRGSASLPKRDLERYGGGHRGRTRVGQLDVETLRIAPPPHVRLRAEQPDRGNLARHLCGTRSERPDVHRVTRRPCECDRVEISSLPGETDIGGREAAPLRVG